METNGGAKISLQSWGQAGQEAEYNLGAAARSLALGGEEGGLKMGNKSD